MGCPVFKTLEVTFTPPSPPPPNGYRVKWRVVGATTWNTPIGPYTSSPILIPNVPVCENIEGTVEAVCGSSYSAVVSFSTAHLPTFTCGQSVSGSINTAVYYTYPKQILDLGGSSDDVTINYNVNDNPNRINVYNSSGNLVISSGWKGYTELAGPWGASLNTPITGLLTFSKAAAGGDGRWYYITAETAGHPTISDAWTASISCTLGTIPPPVPGGPTYEITPSTTTINEGGSATFVIDTTNVVDPSNLYYSIVGSVGAGDFTDGQLTGSFVINSQQGSFIKTLANDVTSEGAESFVVNIHTGSPSGPIVATSGTITVNDTSLTGGTADPTYALAAFNASSEGVIAINEGNNLTIKLTTTGVPDGTHIPYAVTGIVLADIGGSSDALTGTFVVSGGQAVKNFYIDNDSTTEGTETFTLALTSIGSPTSVSVSIIDSSPADSWTGYNLTPVDGSCGSLGADITAYKLNSPGSILETQVLYSEMTAGVYLTSGFYSDGTYKFTVDSNGIVTNKTTCVPAGTPAYTLTPRVGGSIVTAINEGQMVVFTLVTENVASGTVIPWTASGIGAGDLSAGSLSGDFIVGTVNTASFTLANDFATEGVETLTITLTGIGTTGSVTVNDTSLTPVTYYELAGCASGYAWTTIEPDLGTGQRYVNPTGPVFFTYTGSSTTFSEVPVGYNGSIEKTGFIGCP